MVKLLMTRGDEMKMVNIQEAKTNLWALLKELEEGNEEIIVIARHGKPIAQMVRYVQPDVSKRIGIAKGVINDPEDFDAWDEEIVKMFEEAIDEDLT